MSTSTHTVTASLPLLTGLGGVRLLSLARLRQTPLIWASFASWMWSSAYIFDDLSSTGGPPRNWKGIGIALVVILAVMSMVIMSVILLTPDESRLLLRSRLTMEDLEKDQFKVHDPCVAWLNEHEVALRSREGYVMSYNLHTNLSATLVDNSSLDLATTKFYVSADKSFVLLAYDIRQVFSQSFTASYAIYTVANGDLLELSPPEGEKPGLQYAGWGPQGNQLIHMHGGDIYYQSGVSSPALRLTSSGQERQVANGLSDWTYEEEVLLSYAAHWWSVDGARLAYLTINNSATPLMEIPLFLGDIYPSNRLFPYPKAGSSIPSVSLFVVNLYGPTHTLEMTPPDSFRSRDSYVSMVTWIGSTRLAVRWLNRSQNQSVLCVCEATTGACSEKHKMVMDLMQNRRQDVPLFSADGSVFYMVLPAKQGARGEYYHIASVSAQPAIPSVPPRFLTSGNWDVTTLCALDEEAGKIYFLSAEGSRQSRHLYSVDLNGVFQRQCLSCDLIDGCSFFRAEFSHNQTNFILYCLGPGIPQVTLHSTAEPYRYVVLEDNGPLAEALEEKRLPQSVFTTLSADSHDLHLKLSVPQGYEVNLHPLLLLVDGLPGSQSVTEEFALGWPQVLSSTHGVALAWVDGRSGAAGGGRAASLDPHKLGSLRVKDYLGVVEWLMQLPYIDNRRMALYGKAFGGYLALKMLAATDRLFQCSAAAAPITDFRLYSSAFSERYLGLPAKEEHTYSVSNVASKCNNKMSNNTASLLEEVNKLKDENILILHGTADGERSCSYRIDFISSFWLFSNIMLFSMSSSVHFQHSVELVSRLVKVEANYSLQMYPDEGHELREPRSVQHFQRTLVNYLQSCMRQGLLLAPVEEPEEDDN
ncbi:Inactive dipeptidyl peptidase 10 [Merluccius polli]|uniref:Inactive dipeptidyl peptidase 10 n=1 Tax=Merluccius polli TaxID=89951 RepID=A0AA47MFH6_MERPO|nr:Inactive dipeptidyl peptidase 10 [Merluccius polli]